MLFVEIMPVDNKRARLHAERAEAQAHVETPSRRLRRSDGKIYALQVRQGSDRFEQRRHYCPPQAEAAIIRRNIHAPNCAFVAPLDALLAIESSRSDQRPAIECAVNKIFAVASKALGDRSRRKFQVLLYGLAKARRLALQRLAPQPPKFPAIGFGQPSDGVYAVAPLVASI